MKNKWMIAVCMACTVCACSDSQSGNEDEGISVVDVAGAMENRTELKVSQIGDRVRFVTLETHDSCLVGADPTVTLTERYIIMSTQRDCLAFDKTDGHFIGKIGHVGNDPEGYSQAWPHYNDVNGLFYFNRLPDKLVKYDIHGRYQGEATVPVPPYMPGSYAFTDSMVVGGYASFTMFDIQARSLMRFTESGRLIDTIPNPLPRQLRKGTEDITGVSVRRLGLTSVVISDYRDGKKSAVASGSPAVSKSGKDILFRTCFSDTVYALSGNELKPAIVFDTGKWHWPAEEFMESDDNEHKMLVPAVFSTPTHIYYQGITGVLTAEPCVYNGIYCRADKTTRMCEEKEGFTDDLTGFMPFCPTTCNAQGEYGMSVEAFEAKEWVEENADEAEQAPWKHLRQMDEDDNPVIVIVDYKK